MRAATISGMGISRDDSTADRISGTHFPRRKALMPRITLSYRMSDDNAKDDWDCDEYTYPQPVGKKRIIHDGLPVVIKISRYRSVTSVPVC